MNYIQMEAIRAVGAQQKEVKERSAAWMVGEQLKDMCRRDVKCAELLLDDLKVKEMSISEAEKKIKAFADGHKTGSFACVTPFEAEKILREFYGMPAINLPQDDADGFAAPGVVDLMEYL